MERKNHHPILLEMKEKKKVEIIATYKYTSVTSVVEF